MVLECIDFLTSVCCVEVSDLGDRYRVWTAKAVTELVRTLNFFSPQSIRALWANLTSLHSLGAQKATPSSCNEQPWIEHNFSFRLYSGTQRASTILGQKTLPDIQNDFPRPPYADLQPLRCP